MKANNVGMKAKNMGMKANNMGMKANNKKTVYERFVKRPIDFLLALIGLIILSPVIIILAVLVRVKLGSPVIFNQKRPGRNEEIFMLYKFRTMTEEKDENGELLPDELRLTKFGKFIRSTSFDELPELWNILKGDMSFVGPRPLLVRYLPYYRDTERKRSAVRPGMTGLAQVNGRNALNWDERFRYDVDYVEHLTFLMDLKIIIQTVFVVLKRNDIEINFQALDEERKPYTSQMYEASTLSHPHEKLSSEQSHEKLLVEQSHEKLLEEHFHEKLLVEQSLEKP